MSTPRTERVTLNPTNRRGCRRQRQPLRSRCGEHRYSPPHVSHSACTSYSPRSGRIFEALLQEISDMRSANSGDSDKLSALEAEANVRAYI